MKYVFQRRTIQLPILALASVLIALGMLLSLSASAFAVNKEGYEGETFGSKGSMANDTTIAIMSDIHTTQQKGEILKPFKTMLASLNKQNIKTVLAVGDIVHEPNSDYYKHFFDNVINDYTAAGGQVIISPGNHEDLILDPEATAANGGKKIFKTNPTGSELNHAWNIWRNNTGKGLWYSQWVGDLHVIVLGRDAKSARGDWAMSNDQRDWLKKQLDTDLANGTTSVVMCHWPLVYFGENPARPFKENNDHGVTALFKLINPYPNAIVFSGHTHIDVAYEDTKTPRTYGGNGSALFVHDGVAKIYWGSEDGSTTKPTHEYFEYVTLTKNKARNYTLNFMRFTRDKNATANTKPIYAVKDSKTWSWNPPKLTVKYYANGGSNVNADGTTEKPANDLLEKTVLNYGDSIRLPGITGGTKKWNLTKTGHEVKPFWLVGSASASKELPAPYASRLAQDLVSEVGGDLRAGNYVLQLYAKFEKLKYTITFKDGISGNTTTQQYEYGAAVTPPTPATHAGYTFSKWDKTISSVTANATITSQYTPNTYNISFNSNGGTGSMPSVSAKYGAQVKLPSNTFSRTGYTFAGWAESQTGAVKYANAATVTSLATSGTKTLYAVWTAGTYKVTFNGNGSTSGDMSDKTLSLHYDQNGTLPQNTYVKSARVTFNGSGGTPGSMYLDANFAFDGWALSASGATKYPDKGTVKNLATSGTVTLYAKWKSGTITLPNATRNGYSFAGWYDRETGGTKVGAAGTQISISASTTLYARWSKTTYSITYDLQGGQASNPVSYDVDTAVTLAPPTRIGHVFEGWTGSNGTTPQKEVSLAKGTTGNKTYKANWTPATVQVTFEGNGSTSGTMPKANFEYGVMSNLPANAFSKDGYSFAGWSESKTGQVKYADLAKASFTTAQTLWAVWVPKTYDITFDGNGATSGEMPVQHAVYDRRETLAVNQFSKNIPYTLVDGTSQTKTASAMFIGWTADDGSSKYTDAQSVVNVGGGKDTVLHAEWGAARIWLPQLSKDGFVFAGWKRSGSQESGLIGETSILEPTEFVAEWIEMPSPVVDPISPAFSITYDLDGGQMIGNPSYFKNSDEPFHLSQPVKDGYVFDGWTGTGLTSLTKDVVVDTSSSQDLSFTAHWHAKVLTVSFDGNGANSGTMQETKLSADTSMSLPANQFSKTISIEFEQAGTSTHENGQCSFKHWSADGGKGSYGDKADMSSVSFNDGDKLSLQATWNPFTVVMPQAKSVPGQTFSYWIDNEDGRTYMPGDQCQLTDNASFKAVYDSALYQLTLEDGDQVIATYRHEALSPLSELAEIQIPSHPGYTFSGWKDDSGNMYTQSSSMPEKDLLLSTSWDKQQYSITLDCGAGERPAGVPEQYDIESDDIVIPELPDMDDRSFAGWDDGTGSISMSPNIPHGSTGDKVFTAIWDRLVKHTINFDAGGGEGTMSSQASFKMPMRLPACSFHKNAKVTLNAGEGKLPESEIDNVIELPFEGWKLSGGSTVEDQGLVEDDDFGNFTLLQATAMWGEGELGELPIPVTSDSQVFAGWADPDGNTMTRYSAISDDVTLHAVYVPADHPLYTISFDVAGGLPELDAMDGLATVPELPTPYRSGYVFEGWFDSPDSGNAIAQGSSLTSNLVLHAHWRAEPTARVISYSLDEGEFDNNVDVPNTFSIGQKSVAVPLPKKEGFSFAGFDLLGTVYAFEAGMDTVTIPLGSEDIVLTALWSPNEYKAVFDLNTGNPDDVITYSIPYGQYVTSPSPSRTGYELMGWYASADPQDNSPVDMEDLEMPAHDIRLYAHWQATPEDANKDTGPAPEQPGYSDDPSAGENENETPSNGYESASYPTSEQGESPMNGTTSGRGNPGQDSQLTNTGDMDPVAIAICMLVALGLSVLVTRTRRF